MMECLEAQQIISDALDKIAVDDVSVEKAKLHCTTCAECNSFVRGIASTMRAGLPQPPTDLPDRVMDAVRADRESRAVAAATAAAAAPVRVPAETRTIDSGPLRAQDKHGTVVNLSDPSTRRALVAWGSAAAVVLIAAGVFANQGVRQILQRPQSAVSDSRTSGVPFEESTMMAPQATPPGAGQTDASTPSSATPEAAAGDYIAVGGAAYIRSGEAPDVDRTGLRASGSTNSSLDTQGAVTARDVLVGTDPSRVYVERDDRTLVAFDRVVREFQGRQYVLQTGPIEAYGVWPSLPPGVTPPTADDGSPVFRLLTTDPSGTGIYEPVTGGSSVGIAVAPGSSATDPARGNPGWTWWAPAR